MPHQYLEQFDQSWRSLTLPNGLRLLHLPRKEDRRFYIGACIGAGARQEPKRRKGVAHYLEHMMFRGSAQYPNAQSLALAFEWLGGEWNAATGLEHTEYFFFGNKRSWREASALFAEFLAHPRLNDFETERAIIKSELDKETNELGLSTDLDYHMQCLLWPKSDLAHPILGTESSLEAMAVEDVAAFRKRFYAPRNMVVTALGGADTDEVFALLRDLFGSYGKDMRGPVKPLKALDPGSAFRGPKQAWVENPDNEYQLQLGFVTTGEWTPDAAMANIMAAILSDGYTARLTAHLREKLGLVYDVGAQTNVFSDVGSLDITAAVSPDKLVTFCKELAGILKSLQKSGPSATEFKKARRRALLDLETMPSEPENLAFRWSWATLCGRQPSLRAAVARVEALERSDLAAFCARTFRQRRMGFVGLGPRKDTLAASAWEALRKGLPE